MTDTCVIAVENLSKCYRVFNQPLDRLIQKILPNRKKSYHDFWALKNASFTLKKGEAVGIIGRNGSGKSTLLQIITGTLAPTSGQISIRGRIASLLELGAGFNPEFTGKENVYMNGAILGFSKKDMDNLYDDIIGFADIGEFIDQPVKNYSSGMFVRLAFAVQVCVQPDILIVDEALAVGDIFFQQKCIMRIKELLAKNTAVIFVSHDMNAVSNLCHHVVWLSEGEIKYYGDTRTAIEKYTASHYGYADGATNLISSQPIAQISTEKNNEILKEISNPGLRYGNAKVKIEKFALINADNDFIGMIKMGEQVKLCVQLSTEIENIIPNVGFQIKDKFGDIAVGTNMMMLKRIISPMLPYQPNYYTFMIDMMLGVGDYTLTLAVSEAQEKPDEIYDWVEQFYSFSIIERDKEHSKIGGFAFCPVQMLEPLEKIGN